MLKRLEMTYTYIIFIVKIIMKAYYCKVPPALENLSMNVEHINMQVLFAQNLLTHYHVQNSFSNSSHY